MEIKGIHGYVNSPLKMESNWPKNPRFFSSCCRICNEPFLLCQLQKERQNSHAFFFSLSSINHAQELSFLIYFPSVQQARLPHSLSVSSSVCLSFSFLCSVFKPMLRVCLFSANVISILIQRRRQTRKHK